MSQVVSRRERREMQRQQRQIQQRPPAPRRAPPRRSGLWVALGAIAVIVLLVLGAYAAGVFAPGAPPVDIRDPKYDPGNEVVGQQFPDEGNAHTPAGQKVSYGTVPPSSGSHWGAPAGPTSWGIKDQTIPDEATVHNLEHGGIVIAYKALTAEETAQLKDLVRILMNNGYSKIILQPYAGMNDARIAVTAWRWQLKLPSYADIPIVKFVRAHYDGPDAPERGVR